MRRGRRPLPYQLAQRIKTYHRMGIGVRSIKHRTGCNVITIRKVIGERKPETVTTEKPVKCAGCGSIIKQLPCVLCAARAVQKV